MTRLTVTVAIPTIPGRAGSLARAVASVKAQQRQPDALLIELDRQRTGAAETRNRLLARVGTDLVAWLDDDDFLDPSHLKVCVRQFETCPGVDLVYPTPMMMGGLDPTATTYQGRFPVSPWRLRWSAESEWHIRTRGSFVPMTHVVRTESARKAGGFPAGTVLPDGRYRGEDEAYLIALLDAGAQFVHVDRKTWFWVVNPDSTAGKPL